MSGERAWQLTASSLGREQGPEDGESNGWKCAGQRVQGKMGEEMGQCQGGNFVVQVEAKEKREKTPTVARRGYPK